MSDSIMKPGNNETPNYRQVANGGGEVSDTSERESMTPKVGAVDGDEILTWLSGMESKAENETIRNAWNVMRRTFEVYVKDMGRFALKPEASQETKWKEKALDIIQWAIHDIETGILLTKEGREKHEERLKRGIKMLAELEDAE